MSGAGLLLAWTSLFDFRVGVAATMILRWRVRSSAPNTGASLRSTFRSSAPGVRGNCHTRSLRSDSCSFVAQNALVRWQNATVRNLCARAGPKAVLQLQVPCPVDVGEISEPARYTLRGTAMLAAATAAWLVRIWKYLCIHSFSCACRCASYG